MTVTPLPLVATQDEVAYVHAVARQTRADWLARGADWKTRQWFHSKPEDEIQPDSMVAEYLVARYLQRTWLNADAKYHRRALDVAPNVEVKWSPNPDYNLAIPWYDFWKVLSDTMWVLMTGPPPAMNCWGFMHSLRVKRLGVVGGRKFPPWWKVYRHEMLPIEGLKRMLTITQTPP